MSSAEAADDIFPTGNRQVEVSSSGQPDEVVAEIVAEAPEMVEPEFPSWKVTGGELDPIVADYIDLSRLVLDGDDQLPPEWLTRHQAARALVYAAEMTSPERMAWPNQHDEISNIILGPAVTYCSHFNEFDHGRIHEETKNLTAPMLSAIWMMHERGMPADVHAIADSAVRMIYLRQSEKPNLIPPAITQSGKVHAIPRLQN